MSYTSHGHHIPGTIKGEGYHGEIARCGGPSICQRCKREVETAQIHEYVIGSSVDYQEIAKTAVRDYVERMLSQNYNTLPRPDFDVYVIWWSKTLQNWKGILGTTLPDGKIYEVTHNGNEKTTYFDVYGKVHNFAITEPE